MLLKHSVNFGVGFAAQLGDVKEAHNCGRQRQSTEDEPDFSFKILCDN